MCIIKAQPFLVALDGQLSRAHVGGTHGWRQNQDDEEGKTNAFSNTAGSFQFAPRVSRFRAAVHRFAEVSFLGLTSVAGAMIERGRRAALT